MPVSSLNTLAEPVTPEQDRQRWIEQLMTEITPITGRRRQRQTRWTVKLIDRLARRLIIVGGIGTIAAVLSVCVFLLWVAAPLMFSPQVDGRRSLIRNVKAFTRDIQIGFYQTWTADEKDLHGGLSDLVKASLQQGRAQFRSGMEREVIDAVPSEQGSRLIVIRQVPGRLDARSRRLVTQAGACVMPIRNLIVQRN